ncbi:uncharacterized protein LOC125507617 [Triticum urartu]|uniref:uncharacterized protein LOC125507617 n=1 Tax=Triticum urartu TaxID=4572 RepID=UPI002043D7CD|nr:uncharacterized protein LOC125507617 [Triticum urartu]
MYVRTKISLKFLKTLLRSRAVALGPLLSNGLGQNPFGHTSEQLAQKNTQAHLYSTAPAAPPPPRAAGLPHRLAAALLLFPSPSAPNLLRRHHSLLYLQPPAAVYLQFASKSVSVFVRDNFSKTECPARTPQGLGCHKTEPLTEIPSKSPRITTFEEPSNIAQNSPEEPPPSEPATPDLRRNNIRCPNVLHLSRTITRSIDERKKRLMIVTSTKKVTKVRSCAQ